MVNALEPTTGVTEEHRGNPTHGKNLYCVWFSLCLSVRPLCPLWLSFFAARGLYANTSGSASAKKCAVQTPDHLGPRRLLQSRKFRLISGRGPARSSVSSRLFKDAKRTLAAIPGVVSRKFSPQDKTIAFSSLVLHVRNFSPESAAKRRDGFIGLGPVTDTLTSEVENHGLPQRRADRRPQRWTSNIRGPSRRRGRRNLHQRNLFLERDGLEDIRTNVERGRGDLSCLRRSGS